MRARIAKNMGVGASVVLAMAIIALYSLWGATVLSAERAEGRHQTTFATAE